MGVREWVIVLAIIFMVVLALDAWRRVRRQHRYQGSYTRARSPMTAGQTRRHPDSRPPAERTEPRFAETDADTTEVQVRRVEAEAPEPTVSASETLPDEDWSEADDDSLSDPLFAPRETARPRQPESRAADHADTDAEPEPPVDREPTADPEPPTTRPATPPPEEPTTRPGEKVPMLVDSVEPPEQDEIDEASTAAENQYEFDLQAAERAEQDAGPAWRDPLFIGTRGGDPAHDAGQSREEDAEADTGQGNPDRAQAGPDEEASRTAEDPFARARERLQAEVDGPPEDSAPPVRSFSDPDASPFADLYEELDSETTAWEVDSETAGPARQPTVEEDDVWDEFDDIDDPALSEAEQRQMADEEASEQLLSEPEEVLVLTVLAQEGHDFDGTSLLQIMLACGMRFGRMNIFHATDDEGRLQYSAANAYNPGTFDLDNVEHFATRGVTFFLQLPCQSDPMEAFEAMYQSATVLATNLHGDLHDDSRSVMTAQTLTHYRERIRDFQRSQLVKRA